MDSLTTEVLKSQSLEQTSPSPSSPSLPFLSGPILRKAITAFLVFKIPSPNPCLLATSPFSMHRNVIYLTTSLHCRPGERKR